MCIWEMYMHIVKLNCPSCGANIEVNSDLENVFCSYCGAKLIIDDEATKILMVEFYRNLMNGKTKHQSLQEAQQYLRQVDNGKYNDPTYWASFIMLDGLD